MKTKASAVLVSMMLTIVATVPWVAPVAAAEAGEQQIVQPDTHPYGKTLGEWLGVYWRWFYTGADPAQSMVGGVKLMPLPAGKHITGKGTPEDPALYRGQLRITLRPGTPFVLPLAAWTVERYNDGTPDDPSIPDAVFLAGVSPSFFIGPRQVVSNWNKAAFYVPPTAFDPIVVYPTPSDYHSYAAVAYQGYGTVNRPLPVGRHVIHLYEPYIIDTGSVHYAVIYDNTWIVTVKPD